MNKCPKCGYSENESFDAMMERVLKASAERMKKEFGYGVPDELYEIKRHDPEDLGSTIVFNLNRNWSKEWQPEKRQKKQIKKQVKKQ